ncbi:hypothetical protein G7Z17_g11213 [Cylindrodendrum hubeiense]|uniref:Myb-like DNA-binding domain-containing protein n=1 Tax=Cylindrodendrum hubeiense TaxID=595255 RepID=A0A9P5L6K6_9HYPO|nr:hypothetical protein G7Z17_g11213 [Cylindrodendrum hubeiense]
MSKQEPSDQVKFLVSCIGNTNNGRAVADALGIVSKAAAQKRYERMLKAHGIKPGQKNAAVKQESVDEASNSEKTSPTKRKARATMKPTPSKRTRATRVTKKEESDEEEAMPSTEGKDVKQEEEQSPTSPTSSLSDAPPSDEEES